MTINDVNQIPDLPPTQPVHNPPPEVPSKWPTVLGALCIVFGGLAALAGGWGVLSPFFYEWFFDSMPRADAQTMTNNVAIRIAIEYRGWTVMSSLATLVVALIHVVGGIGLLKRRRRSSNILWCWAVLKMMLVVVSAMIGYRIQQQMMQTMPIQAGIPAGAVAIGVAVGIAFAIAWGWAFPVFMMIWLSRGKIREETTEWD